MNDTQAKEIMEKWGDYLNEINPYKNEKGHFTSKEDASIYSLTKRAEKHLAKNSSVEAPARGRVTKKGKVSSKFGMNTGKPEKQCGRLTIDGKAKKKTRSCKDYPETYKEDLEEPLISTPTVTAPHHASTERAADTKKPKRKIKVTVRRKSPEGLIEDDQEESKIRKQDKILPGYAEMKRLGRGLYEQQEINLSFGDLLSLVLDHLVENPDERVFAAKQLNRVGFYSSQQLSQKCRQQGRYSLADWLEIQDRQARAQKGELNKPPTGK